MRNLFYYFKNRPEWINEFSSQLHILFQENKIIFLFISYLILIFSVGIFENHKENKVNSLQLQHNNSLLRELKDINSVLHEVGSNPNNTTQQQAILQALQKDILNAQQSIAETAKTKDIQNISSQISTIKDEIDSKLKDIKKTLSENLNTKEYLDSSTLPFHVISIDVIAGQPYVSVQYANHISPLSIGDELAGWRVTTANYDSSESEFTNEKNQHIKVSLQGTSL